MNRILLGSFVVAIMLTACVVVSGPPGYDVEVAPPLPPVVVLEGEPYYFQSGYYYFYQNDGWRYSRSRSGPWTKLPRSRWPKEIRHRGRDERGGEFRREHEER